MKWAMRLHRRGQNHVFAVAIRAIQEQAVDADPRVVIHGRSHAR